MCCFIQEVVVISDQNVFEQIAYNYNTMSPVEQRISNYFLQHKTDIQKMTISELAAACNTSSASLTRYARNLGHPSFPAFRMKMYAESIQAIPDKMNTETDFDPYSEVHASDNIEVKCKKLFNICVESLRQTQNHINPEAVQKAVDLLWNAKNVFCFGQGNSSAVAMDAWTRFIPITNKFHWVSDSHLQADTAALLQKNDVILYFSFSGSTKELIENATLAKASPGKLILVTHFPNSPGCELADVVLICGTNESPENGGSIAAKIGQLLIIDLLYNEYSSRDVKMVIRNRKKTLAATEEKMQRRPKA